MSILMTAWCVWVIVSVIQLVLLFTLLLSRLPGVPWRGLRDVLLFHASQDRPFLHR